MNTTTADLEMPSALGMVPRVLVVLRYLAAHGRPAGVSEVARSTRLPKTTTHRLLGILEKHGVLDRHGNAYIVNEAGWPTPARDRTWWNALRIAAKPYLVELLQRTGHMASLAVLQDLRVRCLDSIYTRTHLPEIMITAETAPAACTAPGRLLLAYIPDAVDAYHAMGSVHIPAPETLAQQLTQIRDEGIARSRGTPNLDSITLAAPIFSRRNTVIAALNVTGDGRSFDMAKAEPMLRQLAHALSGDIRLRQPLRQWE